MYLLLEQVPNVAQKTFEIGDNNNNNDKRRVFERNRPWLYSRHHLPDVTDGNQGKPQSGWTDGRWVRTHDFSNAKPMLYQSSYGRLAKRNR